MLVRPEIETLPRYKPLLKVKRDVTGPGGRPLARLNANEGPWPPFPDAIEAMQAALQAANWYPDQSYAELKMALGDLHGVDSALISVGGGSANLIRLLTLVLLRPGDEVLLPWPPYPAHGVAIHLTGATTVRTPLRPDGAVDLDGLLERVTERTRLAMICSPHNPTGAVVTRQAFEAYLADVPDHVVSVLDQAYQEFVANPDAVDGRDYLAGAKPVVVFRTFSKVYGLAGVRSGYSFASPELSQAMERARETFPLSNIATAASMASVGRQDLVRERVAANAAERDKLSRACDELGLEHPVSEANFVWIDLRRSGRAVADELLQAGYMVRSGEVHDAPNHIRVTCGRPDEIDGLIAALRATIARVPEA